MLHIEHADLTWDTRTGIVFANGLPLSALLQAWSDKPDDLFGKLEDCEIRYDDNARSSS
jgi:hypothetical protein